LGRLVEWRGVRVGLGSKDRACLTGAVKTDEWCEAAGKYNRRVDVSEEQQVMVRVWM